MQVERIEIEKLTPDPANARKHGERNIEAVVASLNRFGQQKPIVIDKANVVRAGNGTLAAAKSLGWTHINCVRTELDGTDAIAYAIADNRTAELAEWDVDVLAAELEGLQLEGMLELTGFDDKELDEMLKQVGVEPDPVTEDEVPEPPAEPVTKLGDLWILGEHRLLCGDSTNAEEVARLMNGEIASLVHTDPPYGMQFQSNMRTKSAQFAELKNDDKILDGWIPQAIQYSRGWVFVWTTWKVLEQWLPVVKQFGKMTNLVVWAKGGGGIGDLKGTFRTDHELAMVFNRGAELCGKRIGSVWSFAKDAAASYVHPTQKPVALAAEAIDKTTRRGAVVADFFGGSGMTLIACEQTGRLCRMIELDPAYCDVIIKRWENLTGKVAVREHSGDSRHTDGAEGNGEALADQAGVPAGDHSKAGKNRSRSAKQPA